MNKTLAPGEKLSKASVSAMFRRYQEERKPRMQAAFDASAFITRLQACDGNLMQFIMRCIFPIQGQAAYADKLANLCCGAPRIEFLPVKYSNPATIPWKDEHSSAPSMTVKEFLDFDKTQKVVLMELVSLLSLVLLFYILFTPGVKIAATTSKALNVSSTNGVIRL